MDSKNFMAKIMSNISNFQRNIRKAQKDAETKLPNEIVVKVNADLGKLQKKLTKAKGILTTIPPRKEVDIDANIKKATANLKRITTQLYKLPPNKDVNVDANVTNAQFQLKRVTETLHKLPPQKNVSVDANVAQAQFNLKKFTGTLYKVPKKKNVNIDVDTGAAILQLLSFLVELQSIPREKTVHVNVDRSSISQATGAIGLLKKSLSEYQNKMDEIASNIRTFGTIFGQQVKGVMLASFQALIPVIAGLVPALFAVLNAVNALTGGVVAFAGAAAIGFGGIMAYAFMAMSAIKMLNDGTIQASAATRKYQSALQGVKDQWASIIKQNANAIFDSMANGLNTVKTALSALTPFFRGVAQGIDNASKKMLEWAQHSQVAQKFFKMMNTTGVSVFNKLTSAAGHFGSGLISMFTQLAPLFQWSANWLDRLGASFSKWVNSAKGQNSIKQFMDYTRTNLPIIGNIFKNTFAGIFNLMKAFGSNSTSIFKYLEQMSAKFRAWSETVGNSPGFKKFVEYMRQNGPVIMKLIGNIVRALVAFGVAMAPIASALLKVVTAIAGFIAWLFKTHPAIAKVVGIGMILAGIFWALLAPILAVSAVLSNVFGMSILQAVRGIFSFMRGAGLLKGIIEVIKGAFKLLTSPISTISRLLPLLADSFAGIGTAIEILTGPVGWIIGAITALVGIVIWLWNTNEGFRNACIDAWNTITTAVGGAIQGLITWFQQLWQNISETLQPIMPIIQQFGTILNQVLGVVAVGAINILMIAFQTLWTMVSIVWTAIGGIISVAVQIIVGLFTVLIQLLTGNFSGAWLTIQTVIANVMATIWSTLVSIWNQITTFIFGVLSRITGINITSWGQILGIIRSRLAAAWGFVLSIWSRIASYISSRVSAAVSFVSSGFFRMVSIIGSAMAGMISRVISGMASVVGQVASGVSRAVARARSFISGFVSAGADMIRGMIRGIAQMAGALAGAAARVAGQALAAAKSKLGIHSPSREFMSVGRYSMQGFAIGIQKHAGAAIDSVSRAAQNVSDAFNPTIDSDLTTGLNNSLTGNVDAHMTKDVRHSMQENNRPVVNVNVHNESDIPAIKSWIDDQNSRDSLMYT